MSPMLAMDSGSATVIAAVISAIAAVVAAGISSVVARRTKQVERKADEARAHATAAADSVRPNSRGTVMQLLEQVDNRISALAEAKQADHRQLHERITAVVTLMAHYLGPPPPGLSIPPAPPEQPQQRQRQLSSEEA